MAPRRVAEGAPGSRGSPGGGGPGAKSFVPRRGFVSLFGYSPPPPASALFTMIAGSLDQPKYIRARGDSGSGRLAVTRALGT